jgi:hypothetical protein
LLTYACKHWPGWQVRFLAHLVQWEARFRQYWASHRKDEATASLFRTLRVIAGDSSRGRFRAARRYLHHVVRHEERRCAR